MTNDQIRQLLIDTASTCKQADGWIHLGAYGIALKQKGFDFKPLGHYKLAFFLATFPELIEIKEDTAFEPPLPYIRIISVDKKTIVKPTNKTVFKPTISNPSSQNKSGLLQWAWLGDFKQVLKKLSGFAIKEQWYYGKTKKNDYFPILGNYLVYTFFRLQTENKIKEGKDFAAFNTGLVDKKYKSIYALFKANTGYTQKWVFTDFCVEGEEWAGKQLVSNFKPLPERAQYFKDTADMIYDTTSGKPSIDDKHIFVENTYRLPDEFIKENCPKGFTLLETSGMNIDEKKKYFLDLGKAIEADDRTYRFMKATLDNAVELALKRVEWNFKTAIPMYYPTKNKMSLLLPLALVNDDKVDIALVVERTNSGNYLGHTILPLSWSYSNARLVTRPDSDWLVAEDILTNNDDDDE